MRERNGVAVGQRVRDLDGEPLGQVTKLYDDGFSVRKGFPILFHSDHVVRYDEVRGARDGELVIARTRRDLFDLAAGEIPPSWRVPVPPEFPSAATPPEARLLFEDVARGAIATEVAAPPASAPLPPPAGDRAAPLAADEERRYERSARGESARAAPR
jgi:hypothetical protein